MRTETTTNTSNLPALAWSPPRTISHHVREALHNQRAARGEHGPLYRVGVPAGWESVDA